jgi:prepilin-type N-terminal cleavage/methylation domain-containing protein
MSRRRVAGFTLLEIMVVIAIIALLMGMVAVAVSRQSGAGRIADCRARIEQFALLLESYKDRTGDYPPAKLAALGVRDANQVNEGIEAAVAALRASDWGGRRPEERWLGNGDDDNSKSLKSADNSQALLELVDPWDDPIAYIPSRDYSDSFVYRVGEHGSTDDVTLKAEMNPNTHAPWQFDSFQLRSAGPDGVFGTDDDIANFEIPHAGN